MINSKTKTISILLMLLLAFVGCAQPDMQEDLKTLQPVEKGEPVVAVINLPGAGTQTRTILPGELDLAHHYTITLTNDTLEAPIVKDNITASGNQLKLVSVPVGKYNVHIDGHNEAGQIMLKGDGDKVLDITLDTVAEVTVELFPQYGPEMKGSIEVTFDWSAMVNSESATPSDSNVVETMGPLKKAIEEGYLEFELFTGTIGGELKSSGSVIWNDKQTSRKTCRFDNVETGKDIYVALTVKDSSGNAIIDKQYGITAQVYADQVSYYNGDKNYSIPLGKDQDQWYSNVSNVKVTYPAENSDTTFIINWDDLRRGNDSIFSEIRFSYGLYNVAEGERNEKALDPFKPTQSREDNKITVSGLDQNAEYYIKSQTVSKGNKLSDTIIWTLSTGKGFKTKVNLGGITFDPKYTLPETKVIGDTFEVKANITNENATYPNLEYKVVDLANDPDFISSADAIFYINNPEDTKTPAVITANRPGVAKIEATNNDLNDKDHSKITDGYVKVTLSSPLNLVSEIYENQVKSERGIKLTWSPVQHAEQYVVYRSDNSGNFAPIGEPVTSEEFIDNDLIVGHNYKYHVVATAPAIDAKYNAPEYSFSASSAPSADTTATEIPVPAITLKPTVITEGKFELQEITSDGETGNVYGDLNKETGNVDLYISLKAEETKTVGLATPMSGFNSYTWVADNNIVKTGSFEEAGSIILSDKLEQLDLGIRGSHTITFIAKNTSTGDTFSANIGLTLVTAPVKAVTGDIQYKFNEKDGFTTTTVARYATTDAKGILRLSGKAFAANGGTPSVQTVNYRLANPSDSSKATINQFTGVIEILDYGTVDFEIYSPENESIKHTIKIDFYKPTVKNNATLVAQFNDKFSDFLTTANKELGKDWWELGGNYKTTTAEVYRNTDLPQRINGGIHMMSYPMVLETTSEYTVDVTVDCNKILFKAETGSGMLGYGGNSPLRTIGASGDFNNTVDITLPFNQGHAYIKYNNVDVSRDATGSYSIWYEHDLKATDGTKLDSTKENPSVINATKENRPRIK